MMYSRSVSGLSILWAFVVSILLLGHAHAEPVGSAFVSQGVATDAGQEIDGAVDIRFRLFNAATGGQSIGPTLQLTSLNLTSGRFSAELDFGAAFSTDARWLEISIRRVLQPDFVTLAPRQRISPAPVATYALKAGSVDQSAAGLQMFETSGEFVVPTGVTHLTLELWGAGGGGRKQDWMPHRGGSGAYIRTVVPVTPGERLCVSVPPLTPKETNGGDAAVHRCPAAVPDELLARAGGGSTADPVTYTGEGRLAIAPFGGITLNGFASAINGISLSYTNEGVPPPIPSMKRAYYLVEDGFAEYTLISVGASSASEALVGGPGLVVISW